MMSNLSEKILSYYQNRHEEDRLNGDIGSLERERTREIILSFLPEKPAVIADVGAGPGEYSFWLSSLGHTVDLYDLTPRHIEVAQERNLKSPHKVRGIYLADGRVLPSQSHVYDVTVIHGPLYHLSEEKDRLQVLREAGRVTGDDGVILCFAISHTASAIVGLQKGLIFEKNYYEMIENEIKTGHHLPPPNFPNLFVEGHFHRPGELEKEVSLAGLYPVVSLAVQGPAWLVPDFEKTWKDEEKRNLLLKVSRLLEHDTYNSPHFVVACAKSPGRK